MAELSKQASTKVTLEKQLKRIGAQITSQEDKAKLAAVTLEHARDEEMQLKNTLQVLEEARKGAAAKAAADAVHKAKNQLQVCPHPDPDLILILTLTLMSSDLVKKGLEVAFHLEHNNTATELISVLAECTEYCHFERVQDA